MEKFSAELKTIATKVWTERKELQTYIDIENIDFVEKDKQKKNTFAEIMNIKFPATLYTDKVFVIVMYPVFNTISERDKELIMYHELLHITPDDPSKLRDHDIEDFKDMIEQFGLEWEPEVIL